MLNKTISGLDDAHKDGVLDSSTKPVLSCVEGLTMTGFDHKINVILSVVEG